MHELDLIRAAAEDVDSARVLLQERTDALDSIIQTALDHGISMAEVSEASRSSLPGLGRNADAEDPVLVA